MMQLPRPLVSWGTFCLKKKKKRLGMNLSVLFCFLLPSPRGNARGLHAWLEESDYIVDFRFIDVIIMYSNTEVRIYCSCFLIFFGLLHNY